MNLAARNQSILSSTAILGAIVLVVVIGFGIGYVYMGGSPRFSRVEWLRRGGACLYHSVIDIHTNQRE
jgi:hypothetical protein